MLRALSVLTIRGTRISPPRYLTLNPKPLYRQHGNPSFPLNRQFGAIPYRSEKNHVHAKGNAAPKVTTALEPNSEETLSSEDYNAMFGPTKLDTLATREEDAVSPDDRTTSADVIEEITATELETEAEEDEEVEDSNWFVDEEYEDQSRTEIFRDLGESTSAFDPATAEADAAVQAFSTASCLINPEAVAAFLRLERVRQLTVLNVEEVCNWCKDMVIAEVDSKRQLVAIAEKLTLKIKQLQLDHLPPSVQGLDANSNWVAIDAGDTTIHILTREGNAEYDLVKLWTSRLTENREENNGENKVGDT